MHQLYPYQRMGAQWLASSTTALLADTMGLGKSVQAVAGADLARLERVVVVAPASACTNWGREFSRWQKMAREVHVIQGPHDLDDVPRTGPVVVAISWDRSRQASTYNVLSRVGYDLLILDEAHFCKEKTTRRTQMAFGPKCDRTGGLAKQARYVWALSGTPAPNHAGEMWPMVRALRPDAITNPGASRPMDYWQFVNRYCRTRNNGFGVQIVGSKNQDELRQRLSSFVLRRRKEDVLPDLPPIRFETVALDGGDLAKAIRAAELGPEGDAIRAVLAAAEAPKSDPKALAAVSTHVAELRRLTELAKVAALVDLVRTELDSDLDKIVIFAQHRAVIEQLVEGLQDYGAVQIHGGVDHKLRQLAIDQFQTNPATRVFVGQITAAGTAITLTAASNVLFASASWVPADNAQAAMRCHRIGQKNSVLVRFAMLANSLDERVTAVVRRKTAELAALFD